MGFGRFNKHSRNKNTGTAIIEEAGLKEKRTRVLYVSSVLLFILLLFGAFRLFGSDNFYTVRRGDSLEEIAGKFNVPKKMILNLNELKSPDEISEGSRIKIPHTYDIYTVKEGDTLLNIAKENGVKRYELVRYNKFLESSRLRVGDKIYIPRLLSDITIKTTRRTGLTPFKIEFSVTTNTRGKVRKYHWDLGDGTISNKKAPVHIYKKKGIYKVVLSVIDENFNEIRSNEITMNVRALANIKFTDTVFFEVNIGDIIDLEAHVLDNLGQEVDFAYKTKLEGSPKLIEQIGDSDKFKAIKQGYSQITIEAEGYVHKAYFFVSPIKSKHAGRGDLNWYKTQFKTGINGNCGPACTAMSILWATGEDVPVKTIRNIVGLPISNGAIAFSHIITALNQYRVNFKYKTFQRSQEIFDIIDRGHIAIIAFDMGKIERVKGDPAKISFGSFYEESGGHYVIIKGYSENKKYFVVYDPMPADWWMNKARYSDGESMIGRNRYYNVANIMKALRNHGIIEVIPEPRSY